jgi:hypothetical protein
MNSIIPCQHYALRDKLLSGFLSFTEGIPFLLALRIRQAISSFLETFLVGKDFLAFLKFQIKGLVRITGCSDRSLNTATECDTNL